MNLVLWPDSPAGCSGVKLKEDTEVTRGQHLILLYHWPAVTVIKPRTFYWASGPIGPRGYMWTRRRSRDLSEREAGLCFVLPLSLTYIRSLSVCCRALCLYCTYTSLQSRPRCHPRVVCWIITAATRADSDIHKSRAQIKKDECKPETGGRTASAAHACPLIFHVSKNLKGRFCV